MAISKFVFRKISAALSRKNIFLTQSLNYKTTPKKLPINFDFVRSSTLELCYEEIMNRKVKGNVAELGVYKGSFAARLNTLFTDRKLYLFDTFEGFDERDVKIEQQSNFSTGEQDFSDTSVEAVLNRMPHPDNCIVKKGFFPATAEGLSDSFCFVSLDTDLYEPILQGLIFFYPKLEKGGYIFVHDFNNDGYKGARQAVLEYCEKNGISYVPIPDVCGTVIITK